MISIKKEFRQMTQDGEREGKRRNVYNETLPPINVNGHYGTLQSLSNYKKKETGGEAMQKKKKINKKGGIKLQKKKHQQKRNL